MRTNKTKARLLSGRPAYGVSVMIPSPQVVEMLGRLGYDWVLIDCEHGTISLESVELMVIAAEASDIVPIVRPRSKDAVDILNVMDRGAMGVQVPHVNTAADAQAVVKAVKYHPMGTRGLAAGSRPANYGFGLAMTDYIQQANHETLVCVQLEEAQALENIDEIVQVEGVDVFFVGPSDLSQSLGYPGQINAPEVISAIDNAFEKIVRAGKVPGSAGSTESILNYLDHGCLYVYTHLQKLLASGTDEFMAAIKYADSNSS
jgi:4-hydroxy-2-oxoheptanedioate aldolase